MSKYLISPLVVLCWLVSLVSCHSRTIPAKASEEEKFKLFIDSLDRAGNDDLQKINAIRRYVSLKLDIGLSNDSVSTFYYKIPWQDFSPFQYMDLFERDITTARCGLASYILAKLYSYAGYESYIYDCGYANMNLSHEFVLVNLEDRLIVQDAYYFFTITDNANQPKDFLQLLSEVRKGDFSDINIVDEEIFTDCWFSSMSQFDSLMRIYQPLATGYQSSIIETTQAGNRVRLLVKRNFQIGTLAFFENLKPKLKEEGLPENLLSIYLKPLHVKNGRTGAADARLESLIRTAINAK